MQMDGFIMIGFPLLGSSSKVLSSKKVLADARNRVMLQIEERSEEINKSNRSIVKTW